MRRRHQRKTRPWVRWIAVLLLVAAAAAFSFLNSGERVTIDLGLVVLYRISLVGLVFGAFLLGMITMFLFSLRYDRQVRDALRQRELRSEPPDAYFSHLPPDIPV